MNKTIKGFTIVELLIVIVVIAILAAISVVAYTGMQARSRDSIRKQDIASLVKATQLYSVDRGDYAENGCGSSGNGWIYRDYDDTGPNVSINDCLINNGYLQKALKDPSGQDSCTGTSCRAYMKASCGSGTWYLANLETLPHSSTFMDDKCRTDYDTLYGINYAAKVN